MQWIVRPGWQGNLLALVAGALTTLSLAPFDYWPLAILSVALGYLGLSQLRPGAAACRGWFYGFGLFASGTSWVYISIHQFGAASPLLAGLLTLIFVAGLGLFFSLSAWLWAKFLRREHAPLGNALAFAALWCGQEIFRGWFLTGFPWLYSGYSQLQGPLAGLAPLGGVWLIGFCIALSGALLVNGSDLRRTPAPQRLLGVGLLLLPWLTGPALQTLDWTQPRGEALKVAALQGNVAQELKWNPQQVERQLQLYQEMSLSSRPVDIMVWPETAIPLFQDQARHYLTTMERFAQRQGIALLTGIPLREEDATGQRYYYNGLVGIGLAQGHYRKQKLVPFGEYVPLQELLRGLITFFDLPMSYFVPGSAEQTLVHAHDYRIAAYICYEVVYPEFAAQLAARSDLLLTISNDAWFGDSIGPKQHLQMAQMRALESGRWMIRATNNGITALIDPKGQISRQIPAFTRTILYGEVVPMTGLTPYLRWGSWPLAAVCILLLIWAFWQRRCYG